MKTRCLSIILLLMCSISLSSFSQTENDDPLLGLPGDDLDLYAVLNLFQQSKTIEDFEKSLNDEETGIVNLDLNNDGNVDFIKVVTDQDGDDFLFILQDPISETETQDVAVITVSKDADGKVAMQVIGDEKLYGKDYVVEPVSETTESVTSNPAYMGSDPVTVNVEASTQVVVVQSAPVVVYVYSPVYVPYVPPFYYGFYPPYWRAVAVISISVYRHNHYHHHHGYHGGYHGGHGHTTVHVHNHNTYNNYNNNKRKSSKTVNNNIKNGNFKTSGQGGSRPSTSQGGRGSNGASTTNRATTNSSNSNRATTNSSNNNRTSTSPSNSNRSSTSPSNSNRTSTSPSNSNRSSSSNYSNRSSGSRSMGSGSSQHSGGGRSGGAPAGRSGGRRR
ncbi:MAG: hypothetical protein OCD76_21070 [Reichenbachiella sp.]